MQAYRIETTLTQGGQLTLTNLPFQKGERIEIIILHQTIAPSHKNDHSLQGSLLKYEDPTEPVAQKDWEVLQ